ncbi:hypothetical protein V7201_10735 [Bacillus sp. JJ1122]|uniref:hypothetical protein n=1 Tax=Bacillus sp. JJ1122 TaxID=3122951 RepID=UPI002FFD6D2B
MKKELPETYKQILSLIGEGKDNARTVTYISKVLGLSSVLVREVVSDMVVKHGIGIGTSNTRGSSGYYLISNDAEKQETARNLRSRAMKILQRASVISSLPPGGQKKIDF